MVDEAAQICLLNKLRHQAAVRNDVPSEAICAWFEPNDADGMQVVVAMPGSKYEIVAIDGSVIRS